MQRPASITRLLVSLSSLVIIIAGLKAAAGLLGPILLSLFIVLVTAPLVEWLRRRRVPNWLSYVLVVLGVVAIGLLLIGFLGISVVQLTDALPTYRSRLEVQLAALVDWLSDRGLEASDIIELDLIDPGRIIQLIISFIRGLLNTLSNAGLTLFIFIYMLVGSASFSRKLNRSLGQSSPMLNRIQGFSRSISVYLFIKTGLGALTAIGQTLLLWAIGVDFAILWGVLSFLFNYIPNVGYIIALIPPMIMALLEFGIGKALIVFVGYALINNFFDMVIAPRYLGKGLDLSTLVTFLAVIFWTWVLGPIGAFLALPLTVMLKKLLLEPFTDTRLLATLIGAEDQEDTINYRVQPDTKRKR
ncbi:AI-2E family transporter [Thermocoleostomius sinensis]|jgi:predicted PurR-regulated permease PerM|uniref:AI-2E family transporter n=1 Tax=Thermocoleostomius sinensis A174 TaxID=2016057 RepID=A0A9E8ZAJ2_9CYAN|nr:AI-2E family transporter [Thermocoleostomius sinensis]WAL58317.1 AI-2E family transporter [Thermocoleostomius sinensis A174]